MVLGEQKGVEREVSYSKPRSLTMKTLFTRFVKDESGATAIEYGLIAAIVGVGIILSLQGLRNQLVLTFGDVVTGLKAR